MASLPAWLSVLLPVAIFLAVVRWWDRREPEPRRVIARLYVSGLIGGVVIFLLLLLVEVVFVSAGSLPPLTTATVDDGLGVLAAVAVLTALVHEPVKLVLAGSLTAREQAFSERVDGIVYATTVAWGVATVENIVFLLRAPPAGALSDELLFQGLFVTLMTGLSSGVAGLALGHARVRALPRDVRHGILALGLFGAIALHALFRFLVSLDALRLAGLLAILTAVYLLSRFALPRRSAHAPTS